MQPNTALCARKQSRGICSRHDNISDQPSLKKYNSPPAPVPEPASPEDENDTSISNKLHIKTTHISKLYTDDTGHFPVTSITGNRYIMVAYHCDANAIISVTFKSHKEKYRMVAYNSIMQRLNDRDMLVNLQILDNEASK